MTKVAFVLGGAIGVWEEIERAREIVGDPDIYVATNHAGRDAPFYIDHWCSVHGDLLVKWFNTRTERGLKTGQLWTARGNWRHSKHDFKRVPYKGGSSGLLAVDVAIHNGATDIILCGVPLTHKASHYDDKVRKPWKEAGRYRDQWSKRKDELSNYVRSMSGWTKDFFGHPSDKYS